MICKSCKHFTAPEYSDKYEHIKIHMICKGFGFCSNPSFRPNVDTRLDWDKISNKCIHGFGYEETEFLVGENFGCNQFEAK